MDTLILILLAVMPALVIVAGLKDLTSMTIPNWISGAMILAYFPAAFAVGLPWLVVAASVGVGLVALVVGAGMFALRWIGGGDAKLIAASCLWLGLEGSGRFLLWTGLLGGVFCLALLFARSWSRAYLPATAPGWVLHLMQPRGDIPYGVAIAAGALMAYPSSAVVSTFIAG
jgi:prepilin peptidase CpaA